VTPSAEAQLDLGRVYAQHHRAIFAYLLRQTGDLHRAEDLTQDVFADAVATLPRVFQPHRPLLPWLYTVARRRAIDAARADRRTAPMSLTDVVDVSEGDARRNSRAIVQALGTLPAPQRAVVLMRLFHGRSFAEIATALGASESACRMRFSRALRALRKRLESIGVALLMLLTEMRML
jgi:RNA polymerase sigma-70 factor, ECF subfamily